MTNTAWKGEAGRRGDDVRSVELRDRGGIELPLKSRVELYYGDMVMAVLRTVILVPVVVAAVSVVGCTAKKPIARGDYSIFGRSAEDDGEGQESLFKGDSEVLSDADIARILGFQLKLAEKNRLAVLKLGTTRYWSEDHAKIDQDNVAAFLDRLRSTASVSEATELPAFLVPEKRTVPYLREAAARYQADLLLVYDTAVRTFSKYRALGKDEVRALCSVDAVLLDVRTGIVPFTARRTEEVVAKRSPEDFEFSETTAKTVAAAEGRALAGIAQDAVAFLEKKR